MANTVATNAQTTVQVNWVGVRGNREPIDSSSVMTTYTEMVSELQDMNTGTIYDGEYTAVINDNNESNNGPYYITYNGIKYVAHKLALQENTDKTYTYLINTITDDESVISRGINFVYDSFVNDESTISRAINYLNYKIDSTKQIAHDGKLADHFNLSVHDVFDYIITGKQNYFYHLCNNEEFVDEEGNLREDRMTNSNIQYVFTSEGIKAENYNFTQPNISISDNSWNSNYAINIPDIIEPYTYVHYTNTFIPTITAKVNDAGFISKIDYSTLSYDSNTMLLTTNNYESKNQTFSNTIISNTESRTNKNYSIPEFTIKDIIWYGDPGTTPISIIKRMYNNNTGEYTVDTKEVTNGTETAIGISIDRLSYSPVPDIRYRAEIENAEIRIVDKLYKNTYTTTGLKLSAGKWSDYGSIDITNTMLGNKHTIYKLNTLKSPNYKCYYNIFDNLEEITSITPNTLKSSLTKSFDLNWNNNEKLSDNIIHNTNTNQYLAIAYPSRIIDSNNNTYEYKLVKQGTKNVDGIDIDQYFNRYVETAKTFMLYDDLAAYLQTIGNKIVNIGNNIHCNQTSNIYTTTTGNTTEYTLVYIKLDSALPKTDYLTFKLKRNQL